MSTNRLASHLALHCNESRCMAVRNATTPNVIGRFMPHLTRKSRQSTNSPPVDQLRRGTQGTLLSICDTDMEQVIGHAKEQHQTGNGDFTFQVCWKSTKMRNRGLSTNSSLPTPSQPLGVFHSTLQGSEHVRQRFRCLESCLTALCSWESRASALEVTTLPLRRPHSQIECRIRLQREDRERCSPPPCRDLVANVS